MIHISNYAGELRCSYCGKSCKSNIWPLGGDNVPFYFQKEKGKYSLPVDCSECGKTWFVVWDSNPGKFEHLFGIYVNKFNNFESFLFFFH